MKLELNVSLEIDFTDEEIKEFNEFVKNNGGTIEDHVSEWMRNLLIEVADIPVEGVWVTIILFSMSCVSIAVYIDWEHRKFLSNISDIDEIIHKRMKEKKDELNGY
jgi:hypothetical protein